MSRKQYNSATDRKWQQRYQRIQQRKESDHYCESPRKERRQQKETYYCIGRIPDISKIIGCRAAIVCRSDKEIKSVFLAVARKYPQYTYLWNKEVCDVYWREYGENSAMAIETEDWWFGVETSLRCKDKSHYVDEGYKLIEYDELFPVRDLGNITQGEISVADLLGINIWW